MSAPQHLEDELVPARVQTPAAMPATEDDLTYTSALEPSQPRAQGTCTIQSAGAEAPCNTLPLLTTDQTEQRVIRILTDAQGAFKVPASLDLSTLQVTSGGGIYRVDRVEMTPLESGIKHVKVHLVESGALARLSR